MEDEEYHYVMTILDSCVFDQYISKESAVYLLEGHQDYLLKLIFDNTLKIYDPCKTQKI